MFEYAAPTYDAIVAISIVLPISGTNKGVKLIDLIAIGAILTPNADLPSQAQNLSAVVDNIDISGSSPLTRYFAKRTALVIIENHPASFYTGWEQGLSGPMTRASGTAYSTPTARNVARRVYISAVSASVVVDCTAICHLCALEVAGL